jgi:hypothetical protein
MPINHGQAKRKWLCHPHEGVINSGITMRVESAHDLADHACAFDMPSLGAKTHLPHLEQDSSLNWLETISGIWKGA